MVNLNKMYDGVVNSPETYLTQNLAADATIIYVADSSVFGSLPNLAVIGTDQNAETILIKSKRSDGGLEVQRALEGPAKRREKTTAIARNFTNFDYQQIKDNIEKLNTGKQDSLTAGNNIQITNGRISATDTKYDDTQIKKDITELQNRQLSKANQTEAESGVNNTKYMTPQATKQAIEKLSPKQDLSVYLKTRELKNAKLRTNKTNINVFTDRSSGEHQLDIILGDLELRTEENKKNIKTKLSELIDDENHRTVTDEEKQKLNNVKLSRAATFIIANYDSSENSKAGADYVILENESPCDVINSFIEKLPSYGGKIQLTEGHFIEKNDKSINLNKDNITLSGYGESTNLERTFEGAKIEFIKIFNSNITLENLQSNPKNENAVWFSENANKCKIINIVGSSSTVVFFINGSNSSLSNCTGTSTNSNTFVINGSGISLVGCVGENTPEKSFACFSIEGSKNQLSNCTGSSSTVVFFIKGSNNQLSNCTGTSTNSNTFFIKGSNNQLSNCTGTSTGVVFNIEGSNNLLSNCITNKNLTYKYGQIWLQSTSNNNIVTSCIVWKNNILNQGTNNVLANNITLKE